MDGKFIRLIYESVQKYFCVSASMGRYDCIFKKILYIHKRWWEQYSEPPCTQDIIFNSQKTFSWLYFCFSCKEAEENVIYIHVPQAYIQLVCPG